MQEAIQRLTVGIEALRVDMLRDLRELKALFHEVIRLRADPLPQPPHDASPITS